MPKSKPSRRGRRGGRRPPARPVIQEQPSRVVARPVAVDAPTVSPARVERAQSRVTRRDYSYVRRDIQRMLVLSVAVLVTIVVLSFFLP